MKLERAAAHGRSPIRREHTSRPNREHLSSAGLENIIRHRSEAARQARARHERLADVESEMRIRMLEAELIRLRRLRGRSGQLPSDDEVRARVNRHVEAALHEMPSAPVANDVFLTSHENESTNQYSTADGATLPRPARESNLRFELGASRYSRPPRSYMPSPPQSLEGRPVDGPLDTWETTPPLSQDFAPARAARAAMDPESTATPAPAMVREDTQSLETPPPETYEASFHPLRRVAHMSPRPLPRSTIDGLGDRRRSPSPISEAHDDVWRRLLTDMDNNDLGPISSSTTTSMSDLLSAARSDSQTTTNTAASSFGEIGMTADDTCDLPPGITEDDVRPLRERHRRQIGRVTAPRRYAVDQSMPEQDENESDRSSFSILLREVQDSRERRQRRRDELAMLRAIADREESNEPVPNEWWALAGLPSNLGRPSHDS